MEKTKPKKQIRIGSLLGKILGAVLSLAVLAGLFLALIIAQPQPDQAEKAEAQPPLAAVPERSVTSENDLRELVESFPAPFMNFMSGSGMVFVSGEIKNARWSGGYGRILNLYWQTGEGDPLILRSICPADAIDLLGKGNYTFSDTAGPSLFGLSSVRMENEDTVRIHVQAEGRGIYALIIPRSLRGNLAGLARSIQLFTAE